MKITKGQNIFAWSVAFLISALAIGALLSVVLDSKAFGQMYNKDIAKREQGSINMREPEYVIEKTFNLTHSDGASVTLKIGKFRCCDNIAAFTEIEQQTIGFGYFNKVNVNQIGTSTKQQVAQIYLTSVAHELLHLVTMYHLQKGANPMDRTVQEKMAYDYEFLLSQIIELHNDGFISLQNI